LICKLASQGGTNGDRAIWILECIRRLEFVCCDYEVQHGSPLQLIHAGAGSAAMQMLPWLLVSSVLVPFLPDTSC
jgi:hypothetical protein